MKKILIIGAGRSANYLIDYLAKAVLKHKWKLIVSDNNLALVKEKTEQYPNIVGKQLDIFDLEKASKLIEKVDIVVSLVPANFQSHVARLCLDLKKHLVTASYLSEAVRAMQSEIVEKELIFLNEIGLDPGIDHMSAKKIIDSIKADRGQITAFKSFAGALVAPASANNPWHYKFTWNPRNVVLAGQGEPAKFLENNRYKYIPYHQLFKRLITLHVEDLGEVEAYINRDSLKYVKAYGLEDVPTVLRGTIRWKGFCQSWNALVQLGITDNAIVLAKQKETLELCHFLESFLPSCSSKTLQERLAEYLGVNPEGKIIENIAWLGLFDSRTIQKAKKATSAQVLQQILEERWQLEEEDKDMVVMQHQTDFVENTQAKRHISELSVVGEDQHFTAIAKTVGLPAAIATELILLDKIKVKGLCIPTKKTIYEPILKKLEEFGISFSKKETLI